MKKTALIITLLAATMLASCKKDTLVKVAAPVNTLSGFKHDISTAD